MTDTKGEVLERQDFSFMMVVRYTYEFPSGVAGLRLDS